MGRRSARVLFLTVGDRASPGTRLRALAYRPYLEDRGHRVEYLYPLGSDPNRLRRRRLFRSFELVRDLVAASRADVVVVYRKTFPGVSARLLRRVASKVIFEFDDAVYLPSPDEPQDEPTRLRYRRNFSSTVAAADLVVAGNRHLAGETAHHRIEVLPTGVDLSIFSPRQIPSEGECCVLGWIGTTENLVQWRRLAPAFERIVARNPKIGLKVVSNGEPFPSRFPINYERFTIEREAACLEDFDIGLMPLEDTSWNRGKCSYKALQCMAMGLPVVVSPVGMNRDVIVDGVSGFFAGSKDEWVAKVLHLAGDETLRLRQGGAARAVVEKEYALDGIASRMVDFVEDLID